MVGGRRISDGVFLAAVRTITYDELVSSRCCCCCSTSYSHDYPRKTSRLVTSTVVDFELIKAYCIPLAIPFGRQTASGSHLRAPLKSVQPCTVVCQSRPAQSQRYLPTEAGLRWVHRFSGSIGRWSRLFLLRRMIMSLAEVSDLSKTPTAEVVGGQGR